MGEGWPGSRRALGFSALRADALTPTAPGPPWHMMQLCAVPSVPADGGRGCTLTTPSRDAVLLPSSPSPETQARRGLGRGAPALWQGGGQMSLKGCCQPHFSSVDVEGNPGRGPWSLERTRAMGPCIPLPKAALGRCQEKNVRTGQVCLVMPQAPSQPPAICIPGDS